MSRPVDIALVLGLLPGNATTASDRMDATLGKMRHSPIARWTFREPRPALVWDGPSETVARVVLSRQRHGGGALIVKALDVHLLGGTPRVPSPTEEESDVPGSRS